MTLFRFSNWTDRGSDVVRSNEIAELHVRDKESLKGGKSMPNLVYNIKLRKYTEHDFENVKNP